MRVCLRCHLCLQFRIKKIIITIKGRQRIREEKKRKNRSFAPADVSITFIDSYDLQAELVNPRGL